MSLAIMNVISVLDIFVLVKLLIFLLIPVRMICRDTPLPKFFIWAH